MYNEITLGHITIADGSIYDIDFTKQQEKLANQISDALIILKSYVFEYYQEQDKGWKIGWLSPEGRHYPCSQCYHSILASLFARDGEFELENLGWCKIVSEDDDGYFCDNFRLTAEQRNWLSLNGYRLKD